MAVALYKVCDLRSVADACEQHQSAQGSIVHQSTAAVFFFASYDMPEQRNPTAGKCLADYSLALPFLLHGLLGARLFSDGNVKLSFCHIYQLIQHYTAQLFMF